MPASKDNYASELLGPFASTLGHELNNFLTAIVCNAELLKLSVAKSSQEHERVQEILDTSESAREFVGRIQMLGRAHRAILEEAPLEPIDLSAAVTTAVERYPPHRVRFAAAAPKSIPANPKQMETVLREALDSALTTSPTVPIDVEIVETVTEIRVEIHKSDTEPPLEQGSEPITPFSPSGSQQSGGFGLAIAAALMRANGGRLTVAGQDTPSQYVALEWLQ